MIRRDLLKSEIERLAQVLAKIMSLKLEGNLAPAKDLFDQTLVEGFLLPTLVLEDENIESFNTWLVETTLPAEKLDTLSEFMYYELGTSLARNKIIAPKLNLVYQLLANKHKIVHLVNFHRQEIIQQYL